MTSAADRRPDSDHLERLISGLTGTERDCLHLRYVSRMDRRAISRSLGLPVSEVTHTIAIALHKVAQRVEQPDRSESQEAHGHDATE